MQTLTNNNAVEKIVVRNADGVIERIIERPLRAEFKPTSSQQTEEISAVVERIRSDVAANDDIHARLAALEYLVAGALIPQYQTPGCGAAAKRKAAFETSEAMRTLVVAVAEADGDWRERANRFADRTADCIKRVFAVIGSAR